MGREPCFLALEEARRGLRASRDRRGERDAEIIRDLAVAGLQALDRLDYGNRDADWRESDMVKQARTMLAQIGTPLWPGLTESDWADVLRGVLAERDFIGDWIQRCLDASSHSETV